MPAVKLISEVSSPFRLRGMQRSGLPLKKQYEGTSSRHPSKGMGIMHPPGVHISGMSRHRFRLRVSHLTSSSDTCILPVLVRSIVPPSRWAATV